MSVIIAHLSHLFMQVVLPWLERYLFNTAVKQVSQKTLDSTSLNFEKPNLLLVFISVLFLNGLNFIIAHLYTNGKIVPVISTIIVSAVTAFFLLRGFFSPRSKRERRVLLVIMLFFLSLYLVCYTVYDIKWLALISKLVLEVVLCWAVMLSELHRLNKAQSLVVDKIMSALKIDPEKRVGKIIEKYGKIADESLCAIAREKE